MGFSGSSCLGLDLHREGCWHCMLSRHMAGSCSRCSSLIPGLAWVQTLRNPLVCFPNAPSEFQDTPLHRGASAAERQVCFM